VQKTSWVRKPNQTMGANEKPLPEEDEG